MSLRRLLYSCAFGILLTATALTAFKWFHKEKPFNERLKSKKKRAQKLRNIRVEETAVFADLIQGSRTFTFELSFESDEVVHLRINDSLNPRYVVQDVILDTKITRIKKDLKMETKGHVVYIKYKNFVITIKTDAFGMDFCKNDTALVSMNAKKSFVMEENEPYVGVSADFVFNRAVRVYGLPQHAEGISLQQGLYRLFNTDRFGYSASDAHQSLYGAVPLIYAFGQNQTTGLLWLNASETCLDVEHEGDNITTTFFSESGSADFYVLSGPKLSDCVKQYSQLTGVTPLPPLFALGYHQCRYSYMTQEEVLEVSNKFDDNNFPLESVWMDIDYTDDKKFFTWNPETFPNPRQLLESLEKQQRKAVVIIDPHVKVDDDYFIYAHCKNGGFLIRNGDNTTFVGKCWPGLSTWIDFCNPKARDFYAELHEEFATARNLHIWNDMNEPALFETRENSMPKHLLHHGNWKHRDVHNLYGFYQTMATYEGLLKRPNTRPFILTRSHFAGSQRFAAIWTGDNTASWSHLRISVPMCLTASLAGFSLCGADIGGFVKHPDDELLQRWYQLGAWLPFFRGHSNRNVPRREPYLYGTEIQQRIRKAIQERYKHLLHWYTLFWQHCETCEPVVKPLIYHYPDDGNLLDYNDGFLVGEDILVCPVMEPQVDHIDVYLPGGTTEIWYYKDQGIYNGTGFTTMVVDMDTVPVFYRGGSIIPVVDDSIKSSAFIGESAIALYVFCDTDGNATGTLYTDDTESFNFLQNAYSYVRFHLKDGVISNVRINQESYYNTPVILSSVYLYGYTADVKSAGDGVNITKKKHFVQLSNLNVNIQERFTILLNE